MSKIKGDFPTDLDDVVDALDAIYELLEERLPKPAAPFVDEPLETIAGRGASKESAEALLKHVIPKMTGAEVIKAIDNLKVRIVEVDRDK